MRTLRLIAVTGLAAMLSGFAVLGLMRFIEVVGQPLVPSPITVSQPSLDFGSVPLNGTEAREIVIRNDGEAAVHARFVVWGSACRVEPEELILHPGVEWSLTVEARPARPGPIDDVLTIQVLGGGVAPVAIHLGGVAGADDGLRRPGEEINRA